MPNLANNGNSLISLNIEKEQPFYSPNFATKIQTKRHSEYNDTAHDNRRLTKTPSSITSDSKKQSNQFDRQNLDAFSQIEAKKLDSNKKNLSQTQLFQHNNAGTIGSKNIVHRSDHNQSTQSYLSSSQLLHNEAKANAAQSDNKFYMPLKVTEMKRHMNFEKVGKTK